MKVHAKAMTYAKAPPIEAAPASPIKFWPSDNSVIDAFWLPTKQNNTLIINPKTIGWRQRNVLRMKVHSQDERVTYANASPTEAAPASPIWFLERSKYVNVLF